MEKEEAAVSGFVRLSNVITAVQKNLERVKSDRAQPLNLKNGEVFMMFVLYENPEGLSAEALSRACNLDRSLISRGVQSLSEKGLVVWDKKTDGKRRYGAKLTLSGQGQKIGEIVHRNAREIQDFLDEGIPKEHLEIMYATLQKLCSRFEELNRRTRQRKAEGVYGSKGSLPV